ncbi:hypothetical protein [Erythrobacter sp. THAF29]|uniref:hypothetical protein n=1 Tax=Erythrobacter sp. THAF29 TaxID=2587851 RepID=UPI001268C906|nr:hypothetical protein [Erythrobacter sp. THAF29]
MTPAPAWTGTAGSGFSVLPSDPVRTTAKPVARLLTPPNQFFSDACEVGVLAFANDGNASLVGGITEVIFHYEGTQVSVPAVSFREKTRHDGSTYQCLGYWVDLAHTGDGDAHLYVEVIPTDPAQQSRVLGPYSFHPQRYDDGQGGFTPHDYRLEIAPSLAEIAGQRYKNIFNATQWLRGQSPRNPLLTFTEIDGGTPSGNYEMQPEYSTVFLDGHLHLKADVPVTLGKGETYDPTGASGWNGNNVLRTRMGGLWVHGPNISADLSDAATGFYHESPSQTAHVFERVRFFNSKGRASLWLKGQWPTSYVARDKSYFLECKTEDIQNPFNNASLARGCDVADGFADVMSSAYCATYCRISSTHSEDWRTPVDAIAISYSGSNANPRLSLSGGNEVTRNLTLATDAGAEGTFQVRNSVSDFNADTNYTVQNVVDWINGQAGWNATLLDNTRRATALSHFSAATLGGSFTDLDVSQPVTLHTVFDLHNDFCAVDHDNSIFAYNSGKGSMMPWITVGDTALRDVAIVGNAYSNSEPLAATYAVNLAQLPTSTIGRTSGGTSLSNVMVVHNTLSNQNLVLRNGGIDSDPYCIVVANSMLDADAENVDTDLVFKDNHLHGGYASAVPQTIGETSGGTAATLYADEQNGNFSPKDELIAQPKRKALEFDILGRARRPNSSAGAIAPV